MNILFFLKPKSEVEYIYDDFTVRQALEKMEYHKYAAIPIINRRGEYVGTITEGDFLWAFKDQYSLNMKTVEQMPVRSISRRMDNHPVSVNANIEDLVSKAMEQNFVPVIDDNRIFIGIVTRKDVIQFCYKKYKDVTETRKEEKAPQAFNNISGESQDFAGERMSRQKQA